MKCVELNSKTLDFFGTSANDEFSFFSKLPDRCRNEKTSENESLDQYLANKKNPEQKYCLTVKLEWFTFSKVVFGIRNVGRLVTSECHVDNAKS